VLPLVGSLRRLLHLAGYRLEAQRSMVNGKRAWRYRVAAEALPNGVSIKQLEGAWIEQLEGAAGGLTAQKIPYRDRGDLGSSHGAGGLWIE